MSADTLKTGGRGGGDRDVGVVNFALPASLKFSDQTCIQHAPGRMSTWGAEIIDLCVPTTDVIYSKVGFPVSV